MDPDECLRKLLQAADNARDDLKHGGLSLDTIEDLLEHIEALDDWLERGGFLPVKWKKAGKPTWMGKKS